MNYDQHDLFKRFTPTPAKDSCALCDPEKSRDKATRVCCHCTQILTRIRPTEWKHILKFSTAQGFSKWFIDFCNKGAKRFGEEMPTVQEARADAKLTQKQLADLLGMPVRTIQRWEASNKLADQKVLKACS